MTTLPRIAYVNGTFVPLSEAKISIMDRGFLFADGVYEVSAVVNGQLVDNEAHLLRLDRSLAELAIPNPHTREEWIALQQALITQNALKEGVVYIEVTRGVAERDFLFAADLVPTVVAFTQTKNITASPLAARGAKIITVPDIRWQRRDVKSIGLLAQVLAKHAASHSGANEVWMVEEGFVTEGCSSTAFIVTTDNRLVTRHLSNALLPGVTRRSVLHLATQTGLVVEERPFTVAEAQAASEAFFTSASNFVIPVVQIDEVPVGSGEPGRHTRALQAIYLEFAKNSAPY